MTARVQSLPEDVTAPLDKNPQISVRPSDDMASPSSSLSDPEDNLDEHGDAIFYTQPLVATDGDPNDSEAETERLDNTPRTERFAKTTQANDASTRSPSKLAKELSPEVDSELVALAPPVKPLNDTADRDNEPFTIHADQSHSEEMIGRKRKRSSLSTSPLSEAPDNDEPPRKRSQPTHSPLPADDHVDDSPVSHDDEQNNVEDEEEHEEHEAVAEPVVDEVDEERPEEPSHEPDERRPTTKPKARKTRGKAKKAREERLASGLNGGEAEAEEAGEHDGEDDDAAIVDDERTRFHFLGMRQFC